jgi:hypothetical protein
LVTLAVLSRGVGSIDVEVTVTEVFPSEVEAGQVVGYGVGTGNEITKLTVTEAPSSITPRLHGNVTTLFTGGFTGGQLDPTLESLVPTGSVAFNCTPVALLGPALAMTTVYVAVLPKVIPAGGVA